MIFFKETTYLDDINTNIMNEDVRNFDVLQLMRTAEKKPYIF